VIAEAAKASTGRAYVNFLGDADPAAAVYGDETYAQLAALKRVYDPTNLFRLNHNIEPARSS
jgi:FAD/FMN-containing dehydrogenase